jgi:hypothetical protein
MQRSFISMTWTPGVDPDDAQVFIRTIEDIYTLLRPLLGAPGQFDPLPVVRIFGAWAIPSIPQGAVYGSVEWYVKRSMDDQQQHILASRYLETVILEPWQSTSPHFDLALTELPVTDDLARSAAASGALGMNRPGLISLVSLHPFQSIESPDLRRLALRHTCAHYFGRLLDAPRRTRSDDVLEYDGNLYCANTCALRLTDTSTLALSFARQEMEGGALFCPACQKDIVAQIASFHYGLN